MVDHYCSVQCNCWCWSVVNEPSNDFTSKCIHTKSVEHHNTENSHSSSNTWTYIVSENTIGLWQHKVNEQGLPQTCCLILDPKASHEDIREAGECVLVMIFNENKNELFNAVLTEEIQPNDSPVHILFIIRTMYSGLVISQ